MTNAAQNTQNTTAANGQRVEWKPRFGALKKSVAKRTSKGNEYFIWTLEGKFSDFTVFVFDQKAVAKVRQSKIGDNIWCKGPVETRVKALPEGGETTVDIYKVVYFRNKALDENGACIDRETATDDQAAEQMASDMADAAAAGTDQSYSDDRDLSDEIPF